MTGSKRSTESGLKGLTSMCPGLGLNLNVSPEILFSHIRNALKYVNIHVYF